MSKYWIERQEKRENLSFEKGTEAYKEYVKTLEQAKENINAKIAKLYANHSRDTGLSKAETMKIIQGKEYKEWRCKIEDYVKELNSIKDKNSIEFKKLSLELETLASRSRINRLESLKADIDIELIRAGAKTNDTMTNALTKTYTDTYKSLVDDLKFKSTVDMDRVKKVLGYDWSGSNYSKRIWSNTEALAKTVKNEVHVGLNQGINYKTMSTRIADKFNTAYKNAERLVRTEINYIHNQATVDGYKDAGIEKYQFVATLDSRTSQTCASLNGEVFDLKDVAVGINYPPMHPRCRSTTVPIIDYASLQNIKEDDEKTLKNNEKNGNMKENEDAIEIPITLKNFEEHSKKWKTEIIDNILTEEEQVALRGKIKSIVNNSELSMRYGSSNLESLLNSNKFMNQFETGTSGGGLSEHYRMQASKNLFGHNLRKKDFIYSEKYGYLSDRSYIKDYNYAFKGNGVYQYGDIIVRFSKEKLKGKVTYTLDDSLGIGATNVSIAGDFNSNLGLGIDKARLKTYYTGVSELKDTDSAIELTEKLREINGRFRYFELQYHGDISLDDVDEMCFTGNLPNEEILKKLKDKNIKIFKIEGGKDVEI